ncbi:hypothetical protein YC2023_025348 [Brassica napus]
MDQGMTWLLLSYLPSQRGTQYHETVVEKVAQSVQGALKVPLNWLLTTTTKCHVLWSLTGRSARKMQTFWLLRRLMRGDEGPELPNCIELLSGKESFFTISAVTEISSLALSQRWSSSSSQAPVVDVQAGQATSSASNTVDAAKRAMGVDEAKLPSFEDEPNSPNAP